MVYITWYPVQKTELPGGLVQVIFPTVEQIKAYTVRSLTDLKTNKAAGWDMRNILWFHSTFSFVSCSQLLLQYSLILVVLLVESRHSLVGWEEIWTINHGVPWRHGLQQHRWWDLSLTTANKWFQPHMEIGVRSLRLIFIVTAQLRSNGIINCLENIHPTFV